MIVVAVLLGCGAHVQQNGTAIGGSSASRVREPEQPHNDVGDYEMLDLPMIQSGMSAVVPAIANCDATTRNVRARIKVRPDGTVARVSLPANVQATLAACLQASVSRAVFAKTTVGGSFSYTLFVGPPAH